VVACMTDADAAKPHLPAEDFSEHSKRAAWEHMLGPVTQAVGDTMRSALLLYQTGLDWMVRPSHAIGFAMSGAQLASEAAFIAGMRPDSPTRFKGALGVMKRAAWAEPLSLFEVKAISEAFGCSINDVLISCVTGALRSYLLEQGDSVDDVEVRALVPVNLRPAGPVTQLGNDFGLVFLSLPLGVEDPLARIAEVKKRMAQLKHSRQPLVALGILAGMGMAPSALRDKVLEALAANASAVITNVRGAAEARYFAGKRITRQIFWVPQSGGIGMGISILSYAGQVDFGVVTDARRVPDPGAIVRRFSAEFDALLLSALLAPWPGEGEGEGEAAPDAVAIESESGFAAAPNLLKKN
jgi:diacylglycerol O-acyltransferase / wax synthase